MSKRNQFDRDEFFEQNESGYYYPPVFRYPMDDEEFRQVPIPKKPMTDFEEMPGGPTGVVIGTGGIGGTAPAAQPSMEAGSPTSLGVTPQTSQMEPSVFDPGFLQSYLRKNIGKNVRVEFLIGTSILTDRVGRLEEVGISYIVLRDQAGARIVADLYSIKFVTMFN